MKIPINIPDIDDEEIRAVRHVLSEKSLTSSSFDGGIHVQQFEKLVSKPKRNYLIRSGHLLTYFLCQYTPK